MSTKLEYRVRYGKLTGDWYDTAASAMKSLDFNPDFLDLYYINSDNLVIETRTVEIDEIKPKINKMEEVIQAVAMVCTKEQYERDLRTPLLEMGYREECIRDWRNCPLLVNNYMGEIGAVSNIFVSNGKNHNRLFIEDYDPKRFLYLASMKEIDTQPVLTSILREGRIIVDKEKRVGLIIGDKLKVILQSNGTIIDITDTEESYINTLDIEEIREYAYSIPTPFEFLDMSTRGHLDGSIPIWRKKKKYTLDQLIEKAGLDKDKVEII